MEDSRLIRGVAATTHIDRHGDRLSKEALEQMARDFLEKGHLLYWNHETTLPPIGLVIQAWVEERKDGEHQLVYEGCLLREKDTYYLPESP